MFFAVNRGMLQQKPRLEHHLLNLKYNHSKMSSMLAFAGISPGLKMGGGGEGGGEGGSAQYQKDTMKIR